MTISLIRLDDVLYLSLLFLLLFFSNINFIDMIILSPYGERIIDRVSMIGMWIAVVACVRNLMVCMYQYRRTRGLM